LENECDNGNCNNNDNYELNFSCFAGVTQCVCITHTSGLNICVRCSANGLLGSRISMPEHREMHPVWLVLWPEQRLWWQFRRKPRSLR